MLGIFATKRVVGTILGRILESSAGGIASLKRLPCLQVYQTLLPSGDPELYPGGGLVPRGGEVIRVAKEVVNCLCLSRDGLSEAFELHGRGGCGD